MLHHIYDTQDLKGSVIDTDLLPGSVEMFYDCAPGACRDGSSGLAVPALVVGSSALARSRHDEDNHDRGNAQQTNAGTLGK